MQNLVSVTLGQGGGLLDQGLFIYLWSIQLLLQFKLVVHTRMYISPAYFEVKL